MLLKMKKYICRESDNQGSTLIEYGNRFLRDVSTYFNVAMVIAI